MVNKERPILAITIGDPAGVGPEVTVKALSDPGIYQIARPVVYADRCVLTAALRACGLETALRRVDRPAKAGGEAGVIDYIDVGVLDKQVSWGVVSVEGGRAGFTYLDRAIAAALAGEVDAVVTAPLNKESLKAAAVGFIDHTAVLVARASLYQPMTLFVADTLRIFFLTRHIPFREIADAITGPEIDAALPHCIRYLGHLGIENPTLAVAALNPHGGERGLFGREEMDVIAPAVERAKRLGYRVAGPVPADSVFHQAREGRYDGVLSLYHDQGHIAAKTLDFHGTVSLTMGLRFLRTSVDHGTAFDIAGKGIVDDRGMVNALQVAGQYALGVKARLHL
ncbi:MAG: 4-hydroxythreonine-4-phosphate dehydrogenase PdxA [Deltaproteobacteria bacterium]|nr:4-hydroxythreonine-4-phosphate dehydrogenase PdxA [Deltaproteobacteria bacterium]